MKLSEKGYEYVNRLWNKKVPFLNLRLNNRIEQLMQSDQRSEFPLRMFTDLFLEHYQATLDALLQCYLEAYQLEKKIIEESDINGIVAQGFYHWDNHWQMVFQLNPDLNPEREYIQSRQRPLIANMRNDLMIEINKMDLERQGSPPVVPQTIPSEKAGSVTDFTFISDQQIKTIVERDYQELNQLDAQSTPKSILILSGGIIEGILTDALITKGTWTFDECRSRPLKDLIYRAKTDGIIVHDTLADVIKDFRNLVHPAREIKDSLSFSAVHAVQSRAAVDVIIDDVRNWDSKRPK